MTITSDPVMPFTWSCSTRMAEPVTNTGIPLDKPVEYIDLPVDVWGDVLDGVDGMSDSLVTHLEAVAVDHQNGLFLWPERCRRTQRRSAAAGSGRVHSGAPGGFRCRRGSRALKRPGRSRGQV